MRPRRGVALITALFLVVAIAAVAAQFSLDARERRALGLNASDRGMQRALAGGALKLVQAKLDYALRTITQGRNNQMLRSSDPWLGVDSLYSGTYQVDSQPVYVQATDLGTRLNINDLSEDELKTFFAFVLNDYVTADGLAQCVMDWVQVGDMPRVHGAKRADYIKAGLLALPTYGPFRDIEDLQFVKGMTPEIYAKVSPYLTTLGDGLVNLNSAPVPVLKVLPGMTDQILSTILSLRSQGQRIMSVAEVMGAVNRGRRMTPAQAAQQARSNQSLSARAAVNTSQVLLTIVSRTGAQAPPTRLQAIVSRVNTQVSISWQQW
ncbi:MAG: general secretion pathway protein GspK [Gemmatimonadales bacterium]